MPPVITATCPNCGWFGTIEDCREDESGTLLCPACEKAVMIPEED